MLALSAQPRPVSVKRAEARYYGAACGVTFAEAFAVCERLNRLAPIKELARVFPG